MATQAPSRARALARPTAAIAAAVLLVAGCSSGSKASPHPTATSSSTKATRTDEGLQLALQACTSFAGLGSSPYSGLPAAAADAAQASTRDTTWQTLAAAYTQAQIGKEETDKVLSEQADDPTGWQQAQSDTHAAALGIQTGCAQAHARATATGAPTP